MTLLFDFDGTLVDSMPTFASIMLKVLNDNNIKYGADVLKTITPLGYEGTASYFIDLGMPFKVDQLLEIMNRNAIDEYTNNIDAKRNVVQVLRQLRSAGVPMSVLSASPHSMMDPCLRRLGIYDVFDRVWSSDDFSTTKTDPNIFLSAAEALNCKVEDIIFFDDNLNADMTAKSAGMRVCGVFDESSREYTEEIKAVSDYYIYDFSELPELPSLMDKGKSVERST